MVKNIMSLYISGTLPKNEKLKIEHFYLLFRKDHDYMRFLIKFFENDITYNIFNYSEYITYEFIREIYKDGFSLRVNQIKFSERIKVKNKYIFKLLEDHHDNYDDFMNINFIN